MKKIETKKVALLLVGVVLLSLIATSIYYYFPVLLGKLSPTGMASTGLGYATVDITGTLGITIISNIVNLSKSTDTAGAAGAYIATNSTSADINSYDNTSNDNWLNATGGAARKIAQSNISVNNTGTVVANITVVANTNPDSFFGTAGGDFWVNATHIQTTGTGGMGTACASGLVTTWKEYGNNSSTHGNTSVCGQLTAQDGRDLIEIWFKWRIPSAAPAGSYNDTITIIAKQSG